MFYIFLWFFLFLQGFFKRLITDIFNLLIKIINIVNVFTLSIKVCDLLILLLYWLLARMYFLLKLFYWLIGLFFLEMRLTYDKIVYLWNRFLRRRYRLKSLLFTSFLNLLFKFIFIHRFLYHAFFASFH